jgi:MOSC domain-containing protein YiiM
MQAVIHRQLDELVAALEEIRRSPADHGTLAMIVRRPAIDEREVLNEGLLDLAEGLVGDNWKVKPSSRTADHAPHPDMQLNLMNARVIDLIAGVRERWALAGDQLYVDLDLSAGNLPAGTRLRIGTSVIEVTNQPHTGCAKFVERFGLDALKFVNSPDGRRANLRGINARVIAPGTIRVGDRITKEPHAGH